MDHLAVGIALCVQVSPRSEKDVLEDGTVVTLVSRLSGFCMGSLLNGQGLTMTSVLPRKGHKEDDTMMRDGTRKFSVNNVIGRRGAQ